MRTIALIKKCMESEKDFILSSVEKEDRVLFFDNEQELLGSGELQNVEVLFGEPEHSTVHAMKNLRWIQMSWAGANKYTVNPDFPENITLTSASGAYGCVISEYIVSGILALYKNLFAYRTHMQNDGWSLLAGDNTLEGKRVLVLGTGNIGQETAKKLRSFDCHIVGLNRTPDNKPVYFDEVHTIEHLDEQLQSADVVIITLPGTAETAKMFYTERIERMKNSAILVNIGRGFIVDTDALTNALQAGKIKGAVLDVTDPEPLPTGHPLRNMENVVLTPHISGIGWGENKFTRKRVLDIFCENLKKDGNDEPKKNIIDFGKGY